MQVVCGNCQLSFDAPEGASGLVCPICRGPLRAQSAGGGTAAAAKSGLDWSGGDLDDLIAILSPPAVSARVEVLPATGDTPVGEVHLLAGGVADALLGGKSTDDALDKLRAVKASRFRVDLRLPNPANGDLGVAGPESGTLEERPLAQLMRYCEDYVISCAIEVWRGSENARVEYKRGEIRGVTVGSVDAPERLAEVMQWSSGNYRLVVPPFKLPATAPKRPQAASAAPAPVPAPAASAQAARQASSTKTIFGMPVAEIAKARAAAAEAVKAAAAARVTGTMAAAPSAGAKPSGGTPAPEPAKPAAKPAPEKPAPAAAARTTGTAPAAAPASAAAAPGAAGTKTIFGVPAPAAPGGFIPGGTGAASAPAASASAGASSKREQEPEPARTAAGSMETDRKTGARKVSVPGPDVAAPPAAAARADSAEVKRPSAAAPAAVTRAEPTEPVRRAAAAAADDAPPAKREMPVVVWAAVGVFFGAVLLGTWYLVGMLGH